MNINLKELEKQFHSDGYNMGMTAVESGFTKDSLLTAVKNLNQMVDELVVYFSGFAARQSRMPACRKGCSWCCYQPVFAMDYELEYLQVFISENFDEEIQKRIVNRAKEKKQKLEGLTGSALFNSKISCPLLENGVCMVYPARPVACRIYLSSNLESCIKFYNEPDDEQSVPALLHFPMRMGRMLNEGFKAALKTSRGKVEECRVEEKLAG
ncbi:MAG: YkgJ family cysteine cluster protein [Mariniphaga sp.]